jgi:hypothetical protein
MDAKHRRAILACVLLAVVAGAGCSDSDVGNVGFDPEQVEAAALTVAGAVPQVEATEQSILGMLGQISQPAPALDPVGVPSHTEGFTLQNGLTGTMDSTLAGEYTFSFSGTIPLEGGTVTVQGTMVVSLTSIQPSNGATFAIDYDVSVSGPQGSANWSADGTMTVDGTGQLVDYALSMTHEVTTAEGASALVTTVVTPTAYEMVATGPFTHTVRFVVDRVSLTGSVYVNGSNVANFAVDGDCVDIDYVSEEYTDVSVCPQVA